MSLVHHESPEDLVPTRYEIETELAKAAAKQNDNNVVAMRARNKQRRVNVEMMFKARGLNRRQIDKVLSDLVTYENYEDDVALEREQRRPTPEIPRPDRLDTSAPAPPGPPGSIPDRGGAGASQPGPPR